MGEFSSRRTAAFLALVATLLAVATTFAAAPAQAEDAVFTPSAKPSTTFAQRDAAMMRKAGDDHGVVVSPNAIPDAYRICAPNKCVWVEKTRYCPPDTGCGQPVILSPWSGGYCSSSVGCVTMNGRNYHVYAPNVYDNGEVGRVARCAAAIGLNAASYWTRGFSKLALAGTGLATWGCANI